MLLLFVSAVGTRGEAKKVFIPLIDSSSVLFIKFCGCISARYLAAKLALSDADALFISDVAAASIACWALFEAD